MSVEFRKTIIRAGAILASVALVGCATDTRNTKNIPGITEKLGSNAEVTRLSSQGDLFLVSSISSVTPYMNTATAIQEMRSRGCEISSVTIASSGDVVKVSNPKDCLPELK